MIDFSADIQDYLRRVKETIDQISVDEVNSLLNVLNQARLDEKNIFIFGNGGSAATSSHFVCDFNKGVSEHVSPRFKFHCLNDNVPTMMAYSNDIGYEVIFEGPLRNFMKSGDLVIGISGSGNSPNVINAIRYANDNGGVTIGLSGYDGGKLKSLARYGVHIPVANMQIVEDLHMVLDHLMMTVLCHAAKDQRIQ